MVIAFVGAGKMARALAGALVRGGMVRAENLICSSRSEASGQPFLKLFPGSRWMGDIALQAKEADLVVLAIKPQQFGSVMPQLREAGRGKLFFSLAAGITLEKLRSWLDPSTRIIRVMPNTPMQIGRGASVYAGGPDVTEEDFALVDRILAAAGKAWRVEESQIDAITSLSGSGPAYVFHFIEALVKGGTTAGLGEDFARELAIQTVFGAAQLAAESALTPRELADQVKSPGGTTLAGCAELEKDDALDRLMDRCMTAARQRAAELARG